MSATNSLATIRLRALGLRRYMDVGWLLCDRFFRFVGIAFWPLRIALMKWMPVCGVHVMDQSRHKNDNHLS